MAEAEENIESSRVSTQMNGFPQDLLQKFMIANHFPRKFEEKSNDDEKEGAIELSLGLSLNGRFGVNPERAKKIVRSSSIANFMMSSDENKESRVPVGTYTAIMRTCSVPTETEEEWRKRKELQSVRRMDAKRRRFEKLKNVSVVRDEVDLKENGHRLVCDNGNGEFLKGFGTPNWVSGEVGKSHGIESKGERGNDLGGNWGLEGLPPRQPSSQGSIGSQGSGSTGISDFGSQPIQGTNNNTEVKSLTTIRSLPKQIEQGPLDTRVMTNGKHGGGAVLQNLSAANATVADKGMLRNMKVDMPCVSTRGDGPNGKRVEGFLYRYKKGEEVRIVCVCHGCFFSPAEFVKHGGGGDVEHPLKHIVVNPSPIL